MSVKQSNRSNTSNLSLPSTDTKDRVLQYNTTVNISTKQSKFLFPLYHNILIVNTNSWRDWIYELKKLYRFCCPYFLTKFYGVLIFFTFFSSDNNFVNNHVGKHDYDGSNVPTTVSCWKVYSRLFTSRRYVAHAFQDLTIATRPILDKFISIPLLKHYPCYDGMSPGRALYL